MPICRYHAALFTTLLTTILGLPVLPAVGQQLVLEEILVTAQRRVESLQRAPVSVTAFSADTIEALNIVDVEALTRFAPNVSVNKVPAGASNATVRIRGIANPEVIITTDPKVTLYLDDVLIGKAAGSMLDLIDLERIEVLRGPQGTLFGRNSVGGAISVHSREPVDEFEATQSFDVGNLDLFESQTVINLPLMDNGAGTLLARGVYMYHERDGWAEDEAGNDWGVEDRQAGRLQLAWSKGDWSALYAYDQTKWREKIPAPYLEQVGDFQPDGTPKSNALAAILPPRFAEVMAALGREETALEDFILDDRASEVPGEFIGDHNMDIFGHALTLVREAMDWGPMGEVNLKSVTAYRELENDSLAELDATPAALTFFETGDQQIEQFTQEFQFVGVTLDDRLDYLLGLYWFDEEGHLDSYNRTLDFRILGDAEPFNEIFTDVEIDNEAWALFGQSTLSDAFVEGLSLTAGLRYTEEERGVFTDKREFRGPLGLVDSNCDPAQPDYDSDACLSFVVEDDESFDNWSWMVNAAYQWNDDTMSYLRIATGYQSGGFNGRASTQGSASTPYAEETAISYELGVKSQLWQRRLQVNASIFYTDADDLQLASFPVTGDSPNVGTIITNAGSSHIYGGEVEMLVLLTPQLDAYFNYAYLKGEFDEYVIGFDDVDGDGVRETPVDVADVNEFLQSPEHTLGGGLRYSFGETGWGELTARVDVNWQDDIYFVGGGPVQTVNAPELDREGAIGRDVNREEDYALVDALVTLDSIPLTDRGNLKLSLWGRNLLDKDYRYASVDLIDQLGWAVAHYGDPRTYGATLVFEFR